LNQILKAPDLHDLANLGDPDKDVAISCSSRFVARLYDQKKSCASSHHNINKLQVKLATKTEVILPDRKHAKLWSVMKHTEYADEAPLLKMVIYPDLHPDL
jgi:hypothetical protein